ncbi:MAG: response regulator [Desulfomonile tiedjei]|nr:response regulator [Desulfomonile tiedjei]
MALTIETSNVVLDEDYARTHTEVRSGSYVMFAVGDTGVGMDDETLSHVFDPFFTTKEKGRGTGLGLSTIFGIVKQHQRHISVYSEPGLGTVFRVYLPRVEKSVEPARRSYEAVPQRPATETLLVVEDEGIVRTLACELLEMIDYSVLSAANPEEALRIADQHQGVIHLLLTDVVLPQMDGMSLFRRLSPGRPEMKVLYVSGYTQNFIVHHGVLRPGVHFLQKPFTLDSLGTKVRDVLEDPEGTPPT